MAFHLGFELPSRPTLNANAEAFTPHEVEIIRKQIRKNADVIDSYIRRLDLFVNKETHPNRQVFVKRIRERMFLLMEENDTFRRVLWRYHQSQGVCLPKIPAI